MREHLEEGHSSPATTPRAEGDASTASVLSCRGALVSRHADVYRGVPRGERARSQKPLMARAKPMSSHGEIGVHDVMDSEESLSLCHRREAPHVSFALARRLV
jgi:hypothetical protein